MHYKLYDGAVDRERLVEFLREVLEKMNRNSFAIFMDNLSVHKTQEVRNFCSESDILEIFNVPYSPEFNGIECFFALIKDSYKKNLLKCILGEEEID